MGVAGVTALLIAGCGAGPVDPTESSPGSGYTVDRQAAVSVGHVHGLGVDPGDDTLYVASHEGVFAHTDSTLKLVADRNQDTMGFTVAGPGRFLASGHPGLLDEDRPPHLGLIGSTDAAQTWEELSLGGQADFHALDVGTMIYGYAGLSGNLLASNDGRRWTELWDDEVIVDIAASPAEDEVLATTAAGDLARVGADGSVQAITGAPQMFLLDWEVSERVVGVDADGQVWRSQDAGTTWSAAGDPLGAPQAVDAVAGRWHVATTDAVLSSTDRGQTWTPVMGLSIAGD